MFLEGFVILLILLYVALFWIENFNGSQGKPPGPISIPPFGNLIQLGLGEPSLALNKMAKKYGDVMSIKLGLLDTVVVSSYEAFRSIFGRDDCSGRDCSGIIFDRNLKQITNGMIFSEGPAQDETKKFCRDTLRNYGYGNREFMQTLTLDEGTKFLQFMENLAMSNPNRIIHFESDFFNPCFLNVVTTLVMGKRLSYDDPEFQRLLKLHTDFAKKGALGVGIMTAYPFLRYIFPELLSYNIQMKCVGAFNEAARNFLHERKQLAYHKNPECFTDSFLQQMDEDANKQTVFTEDNFVVLFADIIEAGTDTTSNVINFIVLQLMANPSVQEKVYQEVLNVVSSARLPELGDKANMPYTQALVYEGLRWSRVVPMGVPRRALDDIGYKGRVIKKGTIVIWNLHSIFFDEDVWGDPHLFRPERFFNLDGTMDTKKVDIIQVIFGAGKRVCFGEALARDSLFLLTAALIQKFKFSLPVGAKMPDVEPSIGITAYAKPYDAIAITR